MFGQVSGILVNISFGEMNSSDGTGEGLLLVLEENDCIGDSLELKDDLDSTVALSTVGIRKYCGFWRTCCGI